MEFDLIKEYFAEIFNAAFLKRIKDENIDMIYKNDYIRTEPCAEGEAWWYFKGNGIYENVILFINEKNLKSFENEILLLAQCYVERFEYAVFFSNVNKDVPNKKNKTIEAHNNEFSNQRNELIDLISKLNISVEPHEAESAPYIESIVIRLPNESFSINNYTLCYDIANLLREYLKIPRYFEKLKSENENFNINSLKETIEKSTKKPASYYKKFIQDTYPLFLFIKNECNLNLQTDREYYFLIAEFLKVIGFDITQEFSQLPEDYIKNCYKQLKNKGLNSPD
ncbi:MAG: hypothetical protein P4L28_10830 [Paludibacteraceae bacterium]|nr:hypothetical protein [Paludibacteraceae bacterium]